ncbi:hypothetical protein IWQ60_004887 [Tieghemiomyces parasiticus]|uniref:Uncharacterized protein n=1 Tax=Tieghemiomyces parasiticus TaxID=78921 RepID=A0A9W8A805_9FUNG|nr:hypothetical protein IWQ60_004887 [Tieghemiomyces parasiticus]
MSLPRSLLPLLSRAPRRLYSTAHSIGGKAAAAQNSANPAPYAGEPYVNGIYVTYPPEEDRYVPPSQKHYEYTHEGFTSKWWLVGLGGVALISLIPTFDRYMTNDGELPHPFSEFIESITWKEEDSYAILEEMLKAEKERVALRLQNSEDRVLYLAGYREPTSVRRDP